MKNIRDIYDVSVVNYIVEVSKAKNGTNTNKPFWYIGADSTQLIA